MAHRYHLVREYDCAVFIDEDVMQEMLDDGKLEDFLRSHSPGGGFTEFVQYDGPVKAK